MIRSSTPTLLRFALVLAALMTVSCASAPENPYADIKAAYQERVVENLLILSRLESGEVTVQEEIVPLTQVLRRGWRKVFDT